MNLDIAVVSECTLKYLALLKLLCGSTVSTKETEKFESTHTENDYYFEETFKRFMLENCEFYNYNSTVCCVDRTAEYHSCTKKDKSFIVLVVGKQQVVEFTLKYL